MAVAPVESYRGASAPPGGQATRDELFAALGSTGLRHWGGRLFEEFLPELSGDRWLRVIKEMSEQDPMVGSMLFAVDMLIRQVSWDLQPADSSSQAAYIANFFRTVLNDMSSSWSATLSEILSMVPYGWCLMEVQLKRRGGDVVDPTRKSRYDDGLIGWRKLEIRSQDTRLSWEFDESGGTQGMWQLAPPKYEKIYLPIERTLLFRSKVRKGNPEGVSALRTAYRPWWFKKRIENLEGVGIERDLAGMPVAYVPPQLLHPGATAEEKAILKAVQELVTNIRRDEQEGIVFPRAYDQEGHLLYELELMASPGQRQFDTNRVITRLDQRIAMTMMADFILVGHEEVGSRSLHSDKTDLFTAAIGSWVDDIAAVVSEHGFSRLMDVNGFPRQLRPNLIHGDVESVDLNELGNFLRNLTGTGFVLTDDDQRWIREQAGIPVPDAGDDEVENEQQVRSAPPVEATAARMSATTPEEQGSADLTDTVPGGQAMPVPT